MSDEFELLAIGGGPAGLSAVRAYREAGATGAAAIVGDEKRMPYNRPPLTKELLRGEMTEDELPLEDESWLTEQDVSLVGARAVSLDAPGRRVVLSGGRELRYTTCVLTTGSEPKRLPVPGSDDPGARVLRSLDDFRELEHRLRPPAEVIVIGSGFIGCEIAASLARRCHEVTLFSDEPAPNCSRLGTEVGEELARWLEQEHVALHLGAGVERIDRQGERLQVAAGSHQASARVVVMAAGVAPRSELVAGLGVEVVDGAICVDAGMRTGLDGVLAAGDVALAENRAAGRRLHVEHWGDALGQGTIAGQTAAGLEVGWDEVPGFWSTIGTRALKYAAWGDGYDEVSFKRGQDGAFAAWYGRDGRVVGVLSHDDDDSYERGRELIAQGASWR